MAIKDKIRVFIQEVRYWLAKQAEDIEMYEDTGDEGHERYDTIMMFVEESEWVLVSLYDPTFFIIDEDGNAKFNFLHDWTDERLIEFMSDWKTRWGVGDTPAVSIALETINLLDGGESSTSGGDLGLPPGGLNGDHLVKADSGLAWERPATVNDMGENT